MWRSVRWQLAAVSAGAAAVHFGEIRSHAEELWLFGAFFFTVAWFQVVWPVVILAWESRIPVLAGIVVNVVVIAVWVRSRTAGLPIRPEAGEPEAVGAADVLATSFEGLLVVWAVLLLLPIRRCRESSLRVVVVATTAVWIIVVAMTAIVFFVVDEGAVAH